MLRCHIYMYRYMCSKGNHITSGTINLNPTFLTTLIYN